MDQQISVAIFDWAGTAVDFGSMAPALCVIEAFRQHGIALSSAEARGPMGVSKDEHVKAILASPATIERFVNRHGRRPAAADADAIYLLLEQLLPAMVSERTALIPGHRELVEWLRSRGCRIGSTTGYTRSIMAGVLAAAAGQGYVPDCTLTPNEARGGRPAPWMIWRNLEQLGCDAARKAVKFGDTCVDMEEGRNAGTWCVGYSLCGNLVGRDRRDLERLDRDERSRLQAAAEQALLQAGAHLVVAGPSEARAAVSDIDARLARGEMP